MRSFSAQKNFLVGKAGPRKLGLAKLVADGKKSARANIRIFEKRPR